MSLPIFQIGSKDIMLLQNRWSSELNPMLANPSLSCSIIKNVSLAIGGNTVNHLLGRKLQGWRLVRQRAAAAIYDTQDANPNPQLTLTLNASAAVVVDLEVF